MTREFYPLLLQPRTREMVWGGRNLERLLEKNLPPGKLIGETWEVWDDCVIDNGAQRGITLAELIKQDATAILGSVKTINGRFPLLFKFIDAHQDLSVQVHPDDAQAQRLENYPYGKTEAWYVLHAEPDAKLIHGFKQSVDAKIVREYLDQNRLQDLLNYVPVQSGDVIFVPAGTVHAIMRGIVVAEIQENSDITYRLYDWGRESPGRPLHIEPSMRVSDFTRLDDHKISRLTIRHPEFDQHFLVACRYFSFELLDVRAPITRIDTHNRFQILAVIRGAANIANVRANTGQTLLVPAQLDSFSIVPIKTPCHILRALVPDLRRDVIDPLTRAGYPTTDIARLGGAPPRHNDLLPLL